MKLTYPACFYPDEEKQGAYAVEVPDLPGCVSGGGTLAEAILMGMDAASGWVLDELEDGKPAPAASPLEDGAMFFMRGKRRAGSVGCFFDNHRQDFFMKNKEML